MPRGCPRVVLARVSSEARGVVRPTRTRSARKIRARKVRAAAREPGNAPRGQGLDAELHGGAWYRGPVASVRSAARTAGRATGPVRRRRLFSPANDCFPPGFVTQQATGVMNENGPLGHRSRTSMSDRALALQIGGRAPPLGVSSGDGPLRIRWGTSPGPASLTMGGATRVSDAATRAAPRPPRGRRRDSAGDRGEARGRDSPRRGARRWSSTRLERAERKNADFERSRGEGEGEGDPAGTERSPVGTTEKDTANDIKRRLMTKERDALRTTLRVRKARLVMKRQTRNARRNTMRETRARASGAGARAPRDRGPARGERRAARVRAVGDDGGEY